MLSTLFNKGIAVFLKNRFRRMENMRQEAHFLQQKVLLNLLEDHANTEIGRHYAFGKMRSANDFRRHCPVVNYEMIKPMVDRMMMGEKNVLTPGKVKWFAKSSGTTSARSKFIPVTEEFLYGNLVRSSWDAMNILYYHRPDAKVFQKKSLIMGGSLEKFSHNPEVTIGDVSAIMLHRMPAVGRPFYTPDFETALLTDWEEKIARMTEICTHQDVVMFGGVPTWTLVLFHRMLEKEGKNTISEIWPNVRTYMHGGVGFAPYKKQFEDLLGQEDFDFYEVYNASEGYFAIQDNPHQKGMLLLVNNGIYYEFIPSEEWGNENPETITLKEVELGKNYALVISNTAGLWRYTPGDTIRFTSLSPYRIEVSGRTQHFINVFGEEVMVGNTDRALATTCTEIPAIVKEYTVGPIFLQGKNKGGHIWMIEFEQPPADLRKFEILLDKNLRLLNSDYDAKRYKNIALKRLQIEVAPPGTFHRWLRSKGKIGGQNKVPRLSNTRQVLEELSEFAK